MVTAPGLLIPAVKQSVSPGSVILLARMTEGQSDSATAAMIDVMVMHRWVIPL